MCIRLFVSTTLSLWLCDPDFQPQHSNPDALADGNVTVVQNGTSVLVALNATQTPNSTAAQTPNSTAAQTPNSTATLNVTRIQNMTEALNQTHNVTTFVSASPSPRPTSPSPLSKAPSPSLDDVDTLLRAVVRGNQTNATTKQSENARPTTFQNDISGLHALWVLVLFLIGVAYVVRKKGVRVGFWKSNRPRRSKSWSVGIPKPTTIVAERSRSTPGTKTEFDSINTIEL